MVEKNRIGQVILHLIMILLVLSCILPLLLMIISSFTAESSLLKNGYSFYPDEWSLETYLYIGKSIKSIGHGYLMTFVVTFLGTLISVCITILFAYPLSRPELPYRGAVAFFVFLTMLFNGGLVPTYLMYTSMHIKNTIWALIVPSLLMNAFYVIMMRSYFCSNIPDSLIEAARLDGAGEYRILLEVVMPLSKPMVATLSLMIGLGYWNDWLNGLYYITDDRLYTIQNILNRMLSSIEYLAILSAVTGGSGVSMDIPSIGVRMGIAVIAVLPILCIYPFFQKYLIKGIAIGGVKG